MKVKLIKKIEHRNVPGLEVKQKLDLKNGKTVDVNTEAAEFLLEYKYVEVVEVTKPKVSFKKLTNNDEGLLDG